MIQVTTGRDMVPGRAAARTSRSRVGLTITSPAVSAAVGVSAVAMEIGAAAAGITTTAGALIVTAGAITIGVVTVGTERTQTAITHARFSLFPLPVPSHWPVLVRLSSVGFADAGVSAKNVYRKGKFNAPCVLQESGHTAFFILSSGTQCGGSFYRIRISDFPWTVTIKSLRSRSNRSPAGFSTLVAIFRIRTSFGSFSTPENNM
jgi:hypothetical protein